MKQQILIEPQPTKPSQPTPASSGNSLKGLLDALVETLEEQGRLRAKGGHWDELAAIQSRLHEQRAALSTARGVRQP